MNKKRGLALLLALALGITQIGIAPEVMAAGTDTKAVSNVKAGNMDIVYLSSTGALTEGDGSSEDKPMRDMEKAFEKVADNGHIVIVDGFTSRKPLKTPVGKNLTIRGLSPSVYWSMSDYLELGANLKIDSLKVETVTTDVPNRCVYVNGYSFTTTPSTVCFVNENWKQKAYIYAGAHDNKEVQGRKSSINIAGNWQLAGVFGYGGGGAKVANGVSATISGDANADIIDGTDNMELTLQTNKKYKGQLSNIGKLNINAPVDVYALTRIKDVQLNAALEIETTNDTTISGNLNLKPGSVLQLGGDFKAEGEINGSTSLYAGKGRKITSGRITSNASFTLMPNVAKDCEAAVSNEGSEKIWTVSEVNKLDTCYLDGTAGNDNNDGKTPETAYRTFKKVSETVLSGQKDTLRVMITGDTRIEEQANFSGKKYELKGVRNSGGNKPVISFEKGIDVTSDLSLENLTLNFSDLGNQKEAAVHGALLSVYGDVTVNGEPDIECSDSASLELRSGVYGDILAPRDDGIIELTNITIQGELSGFNQVNIFASQYPVLLEKGITNGSMLNFVESSPLFRSNGDIETDSISKDEGTSHITLASGKSLTVEVIEPDSMTMKVLPDSSGKVQEGCYIRSVTSSKNTIRLKDMSGYQLSEKTLDGTYEYHLQKSETLSQPQNVKWSQEKFGRLTWDKPENADNFYYEVFINGIFSYSNIISDNYIDCGDSLKRQGGTYVIAVTAVDSEGNYADSLPIRSAELTYIPAESVHMGNREEEIELGTQRQINAFVMPQYASDQELEWESSVPGVASINSAGVVTAIREGETVITVKVKTDPNGSIQPDNASALTAQCKIKVTSQVKRDYTLTYKMGAGETNPNPADFQEQKTTLKNAVKKGYIFKGWYLDQAYKKQITSLPAKSQVTEDYILYPKWEQISLKAPAVTKLLNVNGQMSIYYQAVPGAEKYQISYSESKAFSGERILTVSGTSAVIKGLTKGRTYYVRVRAVKKDSTGSYFGGAYSSYGSIYQLRYVLNGGTNSTSNPVSYLNTKVSLKNPVRSGYKFLGWYTSSSYKTKVTSLAKGNYTLYAKWSKVSLKKSSITGLQNPISGKMSVSYARISGASGYQIVYSTSKSFTKSRTKSLYTGSSSKTITGLKSNTSYYVRVRAYTYDSRGTKIYGAYSNTILGYSIKYVLNGGKNSSSNIIRYYNTSFTLRNPSRKGYVFKGWYTSKKYKTRVKSVKKGKRTNYKLYAKWSKRR